MSASYYGGGRRGGNTWYTGWDYGQTYDSAMTNPYAGTYLTASSIQTISRAQRDKEIQHYIERLKAGAIGDSFPFPEVQRLSCKNYPDRPYGHECGFHDKLTGMTYVVIVPEHQGYGYPMKVWKGEKMEFPVEYEKPKKVDPQCDSCKEKHPIEKLDLLGRCTRKLASHNAKLRKLFWAHKNK